jgi:hypothetical protein
MKKHNNIYTISIFLAIFIISCRKEPIAPVNESELITTIKLTLTDTAAPNNSYTFSWKDIDGDGGANPIIDTIKLPTNTVFDANLLILNESTSDIDTISNEIEEESTAHQFFYQSIPTDALVNLTYTSFDTDGKPLGGDFRLKTKNTATTSTLRISLIHLVQKSAAGVANGDITNSGGETDIEIELPVKIY